MESLKKTGKPLSPSTVKVCVDAIRDGEPSGTLISPYANSTADFGGIIHMVNALDGFLTEIGFPQAYNTYRSFGTEEKKTTRREKKELRQYMSEDVFETKLGEKLTFVIQVQFRQNSTWQGTITWTEQKKTQRFRSTLEMIKLMDSALAAQGEEEFAGWEESHSN